MKPEPAWKVRVEGLTELAQAIRRMAAAVDELRDSLVAVNAAWKGLKTIAEPERVMGPKSETVQ